MESLWKGVVPALREVHLRVGSSVHRTAEHSPEARVRVALLYFSRYFLDRIFRGSMSTDGRLTICQISDIHCGSAYFIPDLLERSILEVNDYEPTAVVVSGDLTDAGYRQEFEEAAE